jgi:chromosome segregation ATPase
MLQRIEQKLDAASATMEKMMSALTDLKAALDDLATQLVVNNAEIETLLTKITTPGTSDADVEAAVTQIRSLITDNAAEVAKAQTTAP